LAERLAAVPAWSAAALEGEVRAGAAQAGVKLGEIAQPLRAALTGSAVSPGIFEVMEVLGRAEVLGRIKDIATGAKTLDSN
jgi:glutamyl-tRNA synthetase